MLDSATNLAVPHSRRGSHGQRRLLDAAVRRLDSLFLVAGLGGSHLCRCTLE